MKYCSDIDLSDMQSAQFIDNMAAQEGFWENLKYTFTRDSKVADKIKNLVQNLQNLTPEQEEKLKTFVVDQEVPTVPEMIRLCKFIAGAFDWSAKSLDFVKSKIRLIFNSKKTKQEMKDWAIAQTRNLSENHDMAVLQNLSNNLSSDGKPLPDDRTYEDLGANKGNLLELAQLFSAQAAGNKSTMDKITARFENISREIKSVGASPMFTTNGDVGVMINIETDIQECMKPVFMVFNMARKGYKLLDKFLYHTNIVVGKL